MHAIRSVRWQRYSGPVRLLQARVSGLIGIAASAWFLPGGHHARGGPGNGHWLCIAELPIGDWLPHPLRMRWLPGTRSNVCDSQANFATRCLVTVTIIRPRIGANRTHARQMFLAQRFKVLLYPRPNGQCAFCLVIRLLNNAEKPKGVMSHIRSTFLKRRVLAF